MVNTVQCCRSDWPGPCLFCCYQPSCVISQQSWIGLFCFINFPILPPPPRFLHIPTPLPQRSLRRERHRRPGMSSIRTPTNRMGAWVYSFRSVVSILLLLPLFQNRWFGVGEVFGVQVSQNRKWSRTQEKVRMPCFIFLVFIFFLPNLFLCCTPPPLIVFFFLLLLSFLTGAGRQSSKKCRSSRPLWRPMMMHTEQRLSMWEGNQGTPRSSLYKRCFLLCSVYYWKSEGLKRTMG